MPFLTWHQEVNYLVYGTRGAPLDTSRNWTHVIVRSSVPRGGHRIRHYSVWIEDMEALSPTLYSAMYSHMQGHDGNLLPEDARMGMDMRAMSYPVSPRCRHRVASVAAEIQPLCLVASCKFISDICSCNISEFNIMSAFSLVCWRFVPERAAGPQRVVRLHGAQGERRGHALHPLLQHPPHVDEEVSLCRWNPSCCRGAQALQGSHASSIVCSGRSIYVGLHRRTCGLMLKNICNDLFMHGWLHSFSATNKSEHTSFCLVCSCNSL